MRGSIRERSPGRWELRIYVGRHPISGNPRQISRSFEGSKRQAEGALMRLITEVQKKDITAKPVLDPTSTVTALFERFLRMRPLAESTKQSYRSFLSKHVLPLFGHLNVQEVTPAQLNEFYSDLHNVFGLKTRSVQHIHTMLSAGFEFGLDESFGGLTVNPTRRTTLPKSDHEPITAPSPAEVNRMLDPAVHFDQRFLLAVRLAVATGARRGELCGLRWGDLGDNKRLYIARSVWYPHGKPPIIKSTKGGRGRPVTLDDGTWALLTEIGMDPTLNPRDYILSGGPEPMKPDRITEEWRNLCRRLGVVGFRFHDLRHFHATQLLGDRDLSIASVAKRLGHAQVTTTLNIYASAIPDDDPAAAAVISRIMGFTSTLGTVQPLPVEPIIPRHGPAGDDEPGR